MKEQNILPLWEELNEKRNKGIFERQGCTIKLDAYNSHFAIINTPNFKNDADFTVLALNNFAQVCEALEELYKRFDVLVSDNDSYNAPLKDKVKRVLNNIK